MTHPMQVDAIRARMTYTTRAAFVLPGKRGWTWIRWTHEDSNKHGAIIDKARELGAVGWDFGQADHFETARYPFGSR